MAIAPASVTCRGKQNTGAIVQSNCGRTIRWRGVFATHCWIVLNGWANSYTRYDHTPGAGYRNGFEPTGVGSGMQTCVQG